MAVVYSPPNGRKIKSVKKCSELDWCEKISRCLQSRGVVDARECQALTWPELTENDSTALICVAGGQQGKTSGWMLPILNKLASPNLYRGLPAGVGPRVCVFCDGQLDSLEIEEMFTDLISSANLDLKVVVATRGSKIESLKLNIELSNGCDILIINPTAFAEHSPEIGLNLQRCCHVVVESANQTIKNHENEVEAFFTKWRDQRSEFSLPDIPDQIVLAAQEWNESLSKFHQTLIEFKFDPLLVFASLVEAAIFRNIEFYPSFQEDTASRLDHLCHILQGSRGGQQPRHHHKIVICCSEDIKEDIEDKLEQVGISSHYLEGDSYSVKEVLKSWLQSNVSNLIISDDFLTNLPEIPISFPGKVSLVHVGVATCSKAQFEMRFKLMRFQLQENAGGRVHILLGPEDKTAFGSLHSLLTRCSNSKKIQSDIFKKLRFASQDICTNNLGGRICRSLSCKSRHISDVKLDSTVRGREISFQVVEVLSPVTYQVLLQSPELDLENRKRALKVDQYFSKPSNRKVLSDSQLVEGIEVGVEDDGFVKRGRVTLTGLGEEVEVELYDHGEQKRVKVDCMMLLPVSLQTATFPAASVRVTVTGLTPLYRDPHWSQGCQRVVANHLQGTVGRGRVLSGTSEVLWLERCQFIKYSPHLKTWIIQFEVQSQLVSLGWARAQKEFRNHLVKLMDESGVGETKPDKEAGVKENKPRKEAGGEKTKPRKEIGLEKTKPRKEKGGEKTKPRKETGDGGERQENVDSTEEQNPSTSCPTDPYFSEELFEDPSQLRPFFDSCYVIETEQEDSLVNPVAPSEQDVCLKPRIVPSEHAGATTVPVEAEEKRHLTLIWDQDSSSVSISVKCNSMLEVKEKDVSVKVTEDSLAVQVKEGNIVHVLPHSPLALWSFTQPHTVVLTVKAGKISIKFNKKTPADWLRLGKEKFSWITFNFDSSNLDTEEFNNNITEDNPDLKMPKKDYSNLLPEGATEEDDKGTESDSDSDTDMDQDDDNPSTDDENIDDNYVDTDTESGIIC